MKPNETKSSSDVFIVDNGDPDRKVSSYLAGWCDWSEAFDIATGYFEIGSLLCLKEKWQRVDRIRILMGDEVSLRTKRVFEQGLLRIIGKLEQSLEVEKKENDFLTGVSAVVDALKTGKIVCRVYRKEKFHAKAYLTHGRAREIGSFALVGSSNFTFPGLDGNVELNVQIRGTEVGLLREWYQRHWDEAEDVTPEILRTLEQHTKVRTPFEVWFKALHEHERERALPPDEWDKQHSRIFPVLARYQQEAYKNLVAIAQKHGGTFLCDGVGLGKTFVGLMLIERMVTHEGKRVVLFAPNAAREDVWEPEIAKRLPDLNSGFQNLRVFNHTDLQRKDVGFLRNLELTIRDADVVLIDEAHHFRNPGIAGEGEKDPSRYRRLEQFLSAGRPKLHFFLTATPVNNSIHDFRHMVELFTHGEQAYFARQLGIHNLLSHFVQVEKKSLRSLPKDALPILEVGTEILDAEKVLQEDSVFDALVVQRSRACVKQSLKDDGVSETLFPHREKPIVADYDLKATYGKLLKSVKLAFGKEEGKEPLFFLTTYYPLKHWTGSKEDPAYKPLDAGRQKQVVALIRTLFLKRLESSAKSFEMSCYRLLKRLYAWVTLHAELEQDKRHLQHWERRHGELIGFVHGHQQELWPKDADEDQADEFLTEDDIKAITKLAPNLYDISAIIRDTIEDLNQLAEFLGILAEVKPENDDKLKKLVKLLKTDRVLKCQKVLIFSEFADTARYLEQELGKAGIEDIHRIDGGSSQKHRSESIRRFAPYYNSSSSADLKAQGLSEIRVLISTDVLSEGLNLQDATRLINYDLHWNPVRLMQRIGRVDRRLSAEKEARITSDHPDQKGLRGTVAYWNFLAPDELDDLLLLFQRVTGKTLVISRTFGIEGRTLLTPDDKFDPVKEINEQCDQTLTASDKLSSEYRVLLKQHPELAAKLDSLPLKLFSGKTSPNPNTKAVFFCFRIPRPDPVLRDTETGDPCWTDAAGFTVWACYDLHGKALVTDSGAIADLIRSEPATSRHCAFAQPALSELRKKVEKHLVSEYLDALNAPFGVMPILKCWMELN